MRVWPSQVGSLPAIRAKLHRATGRKLRTDTETPNNEDTTCNSSSGGKNPTRGKFVMLRNASPESAQKEQFCLLVARRQTLA